MSSDRDDPVVSKRMLLSAGVDRFKKASAWAAGMVIDRMVDRFTPHVQRPPGAVGEMEFLLACTRCGDCVRACPVGAIVVLGDRAGLSAGTPYLDVNEHRPCVACADVPCSRSCSAGALLPVQVPEIVLGTAHLERESCLAWNGTPCDRCHVACPVRDDAVVIAPDGRVYIDPRACIGCGLCRAACPTSPKSVEIEPPPRV
jgi:MauM/NapG family ferredoxin protein